MFGIAASFILMSPIYSEDVHSSLKIALKDARRKAQTTSGSSGYVSANPKTEPYFCTRSTVARATDGLLT